MAAALTRSSSRQRDDAASLVRDLNCLRAFGRVWHSFAM
jgi:hypothetical protein